MSNIKKENLGIYISLGEKLLDVLTFPKTG